MFWVPWPVLGPGWVQVPFPRRGKGAAVWAGALPRPFPWQRNGPALGIGAGPGSFLAAKERPRAQRAGPVLRGLGSGGGLAVFGVHNRCLGRGGSRLLPRRAGKALLFGPRRFHGLSRGRGTAPRSSRGAVFACPGFGWGLAALRVPAGVWAGELPTAFLGAEERPRAWHRGGSRPLSRGGGTAPRSARGAGFAWPGFGRGLAVFRIPWPVLGVGRV